jgi:hypothetical protein
MDLVAAFHHVGVDEAIAQQQGHPDRVPEFPAYRHLEATPHRIMVHLLVDLQEVFRFSGGSFR